MRHPAFEENRPRTPIGRHLSIEIHDSELSLVKIWLTATSMMDVGFSTKWRFTMTETAGITLGQKDRLMSDLRVVISDTEELLRMTADEVSESAADLRGRVQARMNQAKAELVHLQEAAVAKAKAAGHATDEFVHENPWKSIGIAAGLGLVVGLLISRR
jgi:ElaB/YqjD/DUF883 family membrane-anchored ribosome-binding protein